MIKYILFLIFFTFEIFAQNYQNQLQLARILIDESNFEKAQSILEVIYKNYPNDQQTYELLNTCYVKLKKYDLSRNLISKFLAKDSSVVNLCLMASTEYLSGNDKTAFELWDRATQKATLADNYYDIVANSFIELRLFDHAINVLKIAKSKSNYSYISYEIARLYYLLMNYKDATLEYIDIYKKNPKEYDFVVSNIIRMTASQEAAKIVKNTLENLNTDDKNLLLLLNQVYTITNEYEKALNIVLKLDNIGNKDGTEIYNFANRCYFSNNYKFALKAYKEYLNRYPKSSLNRTVKFGYYKSLYNILEDSVLYPIDLIKDYKITPKDEKYLQVLDGLKEISEEKDDNLALEIKLLIAKIFTYNLYKYEDAIKICDELIKNNLGKIQIDAYLLKLDLLIFSNRLDEFQNSYNLIVNSQVISPDIKLSLLYKNALIEFYQGNFSKAQNIFDDISNNNNSDYANNAILYNTIISFTTNDSLNLLKYANAEYLFIKRDYKNSEDELLEVIAKTKNQLLRDASIYLMAKVKLLQNDIETSEKYLKKLSENENIFQDESLFILGDIYRNIKKDDNQAILYYEIILDKFPNSLYIRKSIENINLIKKKEK
ncbi:MAG TPA: tetratricopeptide repeat protein [Ignavibacteriales bacterium]|nr:tetratricopeptide repeat protein [Ignavibacteriales bacterium]